MKNKSFFNYDITDERREEYKLSSQKSRLAKAAAMAGNGHAPKHPINIPRLDPATLMPKLPETDLVALSLFSGGGGLDLGFERAGFGHAASYDIIEVCGETLRHNRPRWEVHSGPDDGDVRKENWERFAGKVQVMHGGPPCQPFSIAGQQQGRHDERNMWGPYIDAIHKVKPLVFVAENVLGLLDSKFAGFVKHEILNPLSDYHVTSFALNAAGFGVPQTRERVFFVGFRNEKHFRRYVMPEYTHRFDHVKGNRRQPTPPATQLGLLDDDRSLCMGVREALGLPDIGFDILAPTIRSAFTGKRNTTSVLNSVASAEAWASIEVWGSGVAKDRHSAHIFPTENGHFRMSVQDCGVLQGFPESWEFMGAVYKVLGQIGNSVAPPVAYHVAMSVRRALLG